jgi:molybdopterin-containing oxidoreductase family iron-sulfur binding subunit
VQRIRRAEDTAKDEKRAVKDGEIKTACQQACPAKVLVFGDMSDPESEVSKLAGSHRGYRLLEELGTRPRVVYLKEADA